VDVAVIDVPTVLAFGIAAVGEGGHGAIKAQPTALGKSSRLRLSGLVVT
jgi:hypothetical protein